MATAVVSQSQSQPQPQPHASANYQTGTLYVGDLDPDVSEATLYEKFSSVGQVLSIRVCRDQITRQSLGYAYVNFQQPADAERALDTMNFSHINGRPMRIMWSQRDPSLRKSGLGNVFIKNLDKSINNESLYDTFSAFGNILSCKIMTDEKGESKGFGFVHFETQEAADKAIESVNKMLLNDKEVYVGKFLPKAQRTENNANVKKKFTNVFIKNFGDSLDEEKFTDLFNQFGEITSALLARDHEGKPKGFGFVNYKDPESAEKTVEEMNDKQVDGKTLYVGRHQTKKVRLAEIRRKLEERKREKKKSYEGVNLYVKNLDDRIDDERLKQEFSKFGQITSAKVMTENGRSRGFGFVCFKTPEEATRAVSEMRNQIIGSKPLYVALAQLKEDRRNLLVNQYRNYINNFRANQPQMPFPQQNGMYMQHVYPAMYQTMQRPTPRWARPQAGNSAQYQTYQMQAFAPIQQQQQQQPQRSRMSQPSVQIRPNTVNRVPYHAQQQTFIRNQYMVNGGAQMFQQQQQQHQVAMQSQQQVKRVVKGGKDEQAAITIAGQPPLTTDMLASAAPQEQKQMLGERLYPLIYTMYPDLAGKITGMLLEIDNAELIHMLDSPESLREKVQEAYNVLQTHQPK